MVSVRLLEQVNNVPVIIYSKKITIPGVVKLVGHWTILVTNEFQFYGTKKQIQP